MTFPRLALALTAALTVTALTGCAPSAQSDRGTTTPASSADGHGEVAGAEEVSEPPLALVTVDDGGSVGLLDLLDGAATAVGTTATPTALTTDGRYVFVTTAAGVEIVDSGRWSWDHGDHFHYYLADPRIVGTVPGGGPVTVTTGMLSTGGTSGIFFEGSREAVLIDNESLSDGEISEVFRVPVDADSAIVAPLADGAVVTVEDELVFYDHSGTATGTVTECADPSGSLTTRVGLVIGCSDGAVLVTWDASAAQAEEIPYPADTDAPRALSFDARKGRPTVAAVAGSDGFWLLDTRERAWEFVATDVSLARVTAVDDDAGHVVAVDTSGRVRIYDGASGAELSVTEPLLTEVGTSVSLTVDGQRAYLNDPVRGLVYEIDYADDARVARTLETPTPPEFVAEVGRMMPRRIGTALLALSLATVGITGCAGVTPNDTPQIVVTTNILGDVVENLAGDEATVTTLMKPNADPHSFEISAQEAALMDSADLLVSSGLGLEENLQQHLDRAIGAGVPSVVAGDHVDVIGYASPGDGSAPDPHFWTDPARMMDVVDAVEDALVEVDGIDADAIRANADAYRAELARLDSEMTSAFAAIPEDRRKLVTNHHVFGYLAERFDVEVIGAVIPSGTTLAAPSAADLRDLTTAIEDAGVPTIFAESSQTDRLIQVLASEAGLDVQVVELFTESLTGPGEGAETYLDMMRANTERITDGLTR